VDQQFASNVAPTAAGAIKPTAKKKPATDAKKKSREI